MLFMYDFNNNAAINNLQNKICFQCTYFIFQHPINKYIYTYINIFDIFTN